MQVECGFSLNVLFIKEQQSAVHPGARGQYCSEKHSYYMNQYFCKWMGLYR